VDGIYLLAFANVKVDHPELSPCYAEYMKSASRRKGHVWDGRKRVCTEEAS
jgi:hypothetical protein